MSIPESQLMDTTRLSPEPQRAESEVRAVQASTELAPSALVVLYLPLTFGRLFTDCGHS